MILVGYVFSTAFLISIMSLFRTLGTNIQIRILIINQINYITESKRSKETSNFSKILQRIQSITKVQVLSYPLSFTHTVVLCHANKSSSC